MNLFEAFISGVVQGLTEFLPVSSSGHLVLLHHYLGFKEPQLIFDIFLHAGTLLAILVYFRKDILHAFTKDRKFLLLIIVGCIPTGFIGILFESIFKEAFGSVKLVGFMFITTAVLLFCGDIAARFRQHHSETRPKLGFGKALIIGAMQGVAALPGLSRSGATIATALICQVRKKEAIKYSFLMAVPAVIGALIFEMKDFNNTAAILMPQLIIGVFTAFLVGLAAIYYMIQAIIKDRLYFFGIYCFLAGIVVLIKVYL